MTQLKKERTQRALRKAPDASPRETRSGRHPADPSQRQLLGEGARGEGAEATGDSGHCEVE